jgi:K+-sensing histidine kinase KdpD
VKFTDRHGKISIMVNYNDENELEVSVEDNGLGIKEQDQGRIFQMFGTIKSEKVNTGGIGLGLVISKMIVEKFEGSIKFKSVY